MYGKMQECGLFAITSLIMGSHGVSDHGESACNVWDRVWSLGWKDSLEKGMAPHFSILTWKILWVEEPGGLQVHGTAKSWTWLTNNLVITAIVLLGLSRNNMLFFSEKRKLTWLHRCSIHWQKYCFPIYFICIWFSCTVNGHADLTFWGRANF